MFYNNDRYCFNKYFPFHLVHKGKVNPLFGQLYTVLNWSLVSVFYSINFANFIKSGGKPNNTMMLRMCLEINDDPNIDNKVDKKHLAFKKRRKIETIKSVFITTK